MSDKDDMLAAIRAGLGSIIPAGVSSQDAAYDLFERFIFNLVLVAAQQAGATLAFEDIDGNTPSGLLFRTSPGWIYRRSRTSPAYTHAILRFNNSRDLEVHLGVYVAGVSQSLHELDIAVIDRAEAQFSRARCISPRHLALRIGTECKFHTRIKLGTGRAFFGLTADFPRTTLNLVTNVQADSVEFYLTRRNKETDFGVVPRHRDKVDEVLAFLTRAFNRYQRKEPITRRFGD